MKKALIFMTVGLIFIIGVIYTQADDNSLYDDNPIASSTDPSDLLDLSQYSKHGYFYDENVIWVEKSNYTGTQYGCIDRSGNYIIPLTDNITHLYSFNFYNGYSIAKMQRNQEINHEYAAIFNDKGQIVGKFCVYAISDWRYLNNGNIFLKDIDMYRDVYGHSSNAWMFCINTYEFVEMPIPSYKGISIGELKYSDGLLLTYSNFYRNPGIKYYDENGQLVLDVDNSSEYYRHIYSATNFVNGKATVQFAGLDRNYYEVQIDKEGNWLGEPVKISEDKLIIFS